LAAPQPKTEIETRIIGGEHAPAIVPYHTSISISSIAYSHACAATIIRKDWLLTAAHCVNDIKALAGKIEGLPVYAGFNNRSELSEAQVRHIDWSFVHKEFTGVQGTDDIALLHIDPPFEFNSRVRSIAMPLANEKFTGEATAYGWGLSDNDDATYSTNLLSSKADLLTPDDCIAAVPTDAPVTQKNICARTAACYGDGGSPLVMERDGITELVGITSWGYVPCHYSNRPAVYTSVPDYSTWVAEVQWAYSILH